MQNKRILTSADQLYGAGCTQSQDGENHTLLNNEKQIVQDNVYKPTGNYYISTEPKSIERRKQTASLEHLYDNREYKDALQEFEDELRKINNLKIALTSMHRRFSTLANA